MILMTQETFHYLQNTVDLRYDNAINLVHLRTPTHVAHISYIVSLLHLRFFVQPENGAELGTKLRALSTKGSACTTVK